MEHGTTTAEVVDCECVAAMPNAA